jgi:hypothetical protein
VVPQWTGGPSFQSALGFGLRIRASNSFRRSASTWCESQTSPLPRGGVWRSTGAARAALVRKSSLLQTRPWGWTLQSAFTQGSELKVTISGKDKAQSEEGYEPFADGSHGEGPPSLLAKFSKIGAEPDPGKSRQEGQRERLAKLASWVLAKRYSVANS